MLHEEKYQYCYTSFQCTLFPKSATKMVQNCQTWDCISQWYLFRFLNCWEMLGCACCWTAPAQLLLNCCSTAQFQLTFMTDAQMLNDMYSAINPFSTTQTIPSNPKQILAWYKYVQYPSCYYCERKEPTMRSHLQSQLLLVTWALLNGLHVHFGAYNTTQ